MRPPALRKPGRPLTRTAALRRRTARPLRSRGRHRRVHPDGCGTNGSGARHLLDGLCRTVCSSSHGRKPVTEVPRNRRRRLGPRRDGARRAACTAQSTVEGLLNSAANRRGCPLTADSGCSARPSSISLAFSLCPLSGGRQQHGLCRGRRSMGRTAAAPSWWPSHPGRPNADCRDAVSEERWLWPRGRWRTRRPRAGRNGVVEGATPTTHRGTRPPGRRGHRRSHPADRSSARFVEDRPLKMRGPLVLGRGGAGIQRVQARPLSDDDPGSGGGAVRAGPGVALGRCGCAT